MKEQDNFYRRTVGKSLVDTVTEMKKVRIRIYDPQHGLSATYVTADEAEKIGQALLQAAKLLNEI